MGGIFAAGIMTPNDRIKCLLQTQAATIANNKSKTNKITKYNGTIDCAYKLYRKGGIRNLYKGFTATLMRDVPAKAGYFGTYEYLKKEFRQNNIELNAAVTIFMGGVSGIVNWIIAMPFDVAKSRYQTAPDGVYKNLSHVYRNLFKTEGIFGFYKGLSPVMLRAFPANAACFLGYETTLKIFNYY
jgi:solute carrier family 25 (mitochondrial carnitine/acylcarnitine transporter), member 20/29